MKEYTILAVLSVFFTLVIDRALNIRVLIRKEYYIFLFVILFFKFLVNGYLTGKEIVIYNPVFFLGIRIGSIPVEDFFFGFSMITLTIIFWEYFKRRARC
ncbi:MAG: lycopene cyclase domain-containing protein [Candidatus Omnitrophica bacterium]|nr:lycopene cyclase domain-containing protein [Candidatus Omnitrophota bacterium]